MLFPGTARYKQWIQSPSGKKRDEFFFWVKVRVVVWCVCDFAVCLGYSTPFSVASLIFIPPDTRKTMGRRKKKTKTRVSATSQVLLRFCCLKHAPHDESESGAPRRPSHLQLLKCCQIRAFAGMPTRHVPALADDQHGVFWWFAGTGVEGSLWTRCGTWPLLGSFWKLNSTRLLAAGCETHTQECDMTGNWQRSGRITRSVLIDIGLRLFLLECCSWYADLTYNCMDNAFCVAWSLSAESNVLVLLSDFGVAVWLEFCCLWIEIRRCVSERDIMIQLEASLASPSEKSLKAKSWKSNSCFFPRKFEILDSRARIAQEGRIGVSLFKDLQIKLNLFFYLAFFRTELHPVPENKKMG